jgi:hypothetical protein
MILVIIIPTPTDRWRIQLYEISNSQIHKLVLQTSLRRRRNLIDDDQQKGAKYVD